MQHVKFEQVSRILPTLEKKSRILSLEKKTFKDS
jgi:hypothetical protein